MTGIVKRSAQPAEKLIVDALPRRGHSDGGVEGSALPLREQVRRLMAAQRQRLVSAHATLLQTGRVEVDAERAVVDLRHLQYHERAQSDGAEVDASLSQIHRRGMAQHVRRGALLRQGGAPIGGALDVLFDEAFDSIGTEPAAIGAREERRVGCRAALPEPRGERADRVFPQRRAPALAPLAFALHMRPGAENDEVCLMVSLLDQVASGSYL